MRALVGFLLGAAACAAVTTERGRRLCDEFAEELTERAKRAIKEDITDEEVTHDCEGNAHDKA